MTENPIGVLIEELINAGLSEYQIAERVGTNQTRINRFKKRGASQYELCEKIKDLHQRHFSNSQQDSAA
ncbi:MAG: hypothetical protein CSH37_14025 [Thalassolituus sp.]|nr:MAG: hypothetical protein CSH37_14025 [Thalassolituus sp.]